VRTIEKGVVVNELRRQYPQRRKGKEEKRRKGKGGRVEGKGEREEEASDTNG